MNSYQTLNAAAFISGIPVRDAVAWGQAWQVKTGPYPKLADAQQFRQGVRRQQLAADVDDSTSAVTGEDEGPGRWNDEDKARQLNLCRNA